MVEPDESRDWALHDRQAKLIIGALLTLQVLLLLSTLLWA